MMMKCLLPWWRKPEYPKETTDLQQVTDEHGRRSGGTRPPWKLSGGIVPPGVLNAIFFLLAAHMQGLPKEQTTTPEA